jgi:hypothetical protein
MSVIRMIAFLGFVAMFTRPAPVPAQVCVGDCNGDGQVTIDEIILGVNIALGASLIGNCLALDADLNGEATVDEIVSAVSNALRGCPSGCNMSGQWQVTVTQLQPPEPPETSSVELMQDAFAQVQIVGFPAFRATALGSILRVNYCDCALGELLCVQGDLAIEPGCNSFSGVLDYVEFGMQTACVFMDPGQIVDVGRESVEAVREAP